MFTLSAAGDVKSVQVGLFMQFVVQGAVYICLSEICALSKQGHILIKQYSFKIANALVFLYRQKLTFDI